MARGWESKSVEAQQAEASKKPGRGRERLSPEQAAHRRERQGLELSRRRVLQQLESTHDPRLTEMLRQALADIDKKLQPPSS